jgi:hypothetical protein
VDLKLGPESSDHHGEDWSGLSRDSKDDADRPEAVQGLQRDWIEAAQKSLEKRKGLSGEYLQFVDFQRMQKLATGCQ